MTTTYTRNLLAAEALNNLFSGGGPTQAAEAEDIAFVEGYIDAVAAELDARGIVTIADLNDIEPRYFLPLAELLANECAPRYGKPKNPAIKEGAEERLKVMVNNTPAANSTLKCEPAVTGGRVGMTVAQWTRGG